MPCMIHLKVFFGLSYNPSHGMNVLPAYDFKSTWAQRPFLELDATLPL